MKIKIENHSKGFILNTLTLSMMLLSASAHALQALDDGDMREISGQDGVHIATTFDEAKVDALYWTDEAGRGTASAPADKQKLTAIAENVSIIKSNSSALGPGADLRLDAGSNATGKTGVDLQLSLNPMLAKVDSFSICDSDGATNKCSDKIGSVAIQTGSPTAISLKTQDGLFSRDSQTTMTIGLQNANIYLGQTDVNNQLNQLILKNMNFNFIGKGFVFIDPVNGFMMQTNKGAAATTSTTPSADFGYVDFNRVVDSAAANAGYPNGGTYAENGKSTNAGLNLEFMLNKRVDTSNPYALDASNTPVGAQGLIRVGASGRMVNGSLQLRGLTTNGATDTLGKADRPGGTSTNNVSGNSGIAFRMKADFTKEGDTMLGSDGKATTLEIGGAGLNSYGFEFGNLTGLTAGTRGSFDSGNVFINLVDTKTVELPTNYLFQNSRFGNNSYLTTSADYKQNLHDQVSNPYALLASIRGAEFQSLSRRGRFTYSPGVGAANQYTNNGLNNEWGLGLPFYNLNANIAMFGTSVPGNSVYYYTNDGKRNEVNAGIGNTARLGFSMAMSTQGTDLDATNKALGNKTTSILVIDGGDNDPIKAGVQPTDYYMGLRNIDMLLKGNGTIGVENGSLNIGLKNMLIVMAAEVAAGYLPGTTYKSCVGSAANANVTTACNAQKASAMNNFALKNDVLIGAKLRLGGDMNFSLIPNNSLPAGAALGIIGDLTLASTGNTIQLSDPENGSTLGLDNLVGKVAFSNAIVIGRDATSGNGTVGFNSTFKLNPDANPAGVFRAKDLNFYGPNSGMPARLGEVAITGGRLSSQFSIIPR